MGARIDVLDARSCKPIETDRFSNVTISSAGSEWRHVAVEERHYLQAELSDMMHTQHVIRINMGPLLICERKENGFLKPVRVSPRDVCFFPDSVPFFRRFDRRAEVLMLALDPAFVARVASDLVYPDRIEFVTLHRGPDPALEHIAMALREGARTSCARDRMYGEGLATALAVRLIRDYNQGAMFNERAAAGGLSREKLRRAVEYIRDQLAADLTVADIASQVNMSPYHFMRCFKQSTGSSPHQYLVNARVEQAMQLLASGGRTISEVAHDVGFADQSHLARHLKRTRGVTPKALLLPGV